MKLTLEYRGVADVDWLGFYSLRRRSGLDNGKLADAGRPCGISDDPYAFNAWSYFF